MLATAKNRGRDRKWFILQVGERRSVVDEKESFYNADMKRNKAEEVEREVRHGLTKEGSL